MNRDHYRLVFNPTLGMMVPVAEMARRSGKSGQRKAASGAALALAGVLSAGPVQAELPVAAANFVTAGSALLPTQVGSRLLVNQTSDKAVLNWQSFNVSTGHEVQFRQIDGAGQLVPGANFTSLNRIWDLNPSVIAGSITQAVGQKANVILVNTNGIAFMGGSQVNLNTFTASTLNIADSFILNSFLGDPTKPQFEGTTGFIKVFEGAQITAGSQGRVMLIAPTVVNKGKVTAPDGQVIAAAGAKVYLRSATGDDDNVRGLLVEVERPAGLADADSANADVKDGVLDGQAVDLTNAAEDKLGHVTNLGELTAQRGNVTMVGFAVNQLGIARATTSVVANGSVYLMAKDGITTNAGLLTATNIGATSAGRVVLGENSLTEILPDVADPTTGLDGTTGTGLAKISQVKILGRDIRMAGGATIDAPAAAVEFRATDNPSDPTVLRDAGQNASDTARIHIASGARIDVAGLENVAVSVARNSVEVELRGDELKDSPVNQQGPLRGEKVYVDINRALANSDAGKATLIARDSLESYQAKLERGVAERSTAGGTVHVLSEGETILEHGAVFDLSGGSVKYTAGTVKTTLLTTNGKPVDIADAGGQTRYDGIATRFVKNYGRWNVKEVIDLGQSYRYDPGYVEGRDAGALNVVGMKAVVMQADVQGRTTTGELQRDAGVSPAGARLAIGRDVVDFSTNRHDYKLNQRVEIADNGATLPADFKFGDELAQTLKDTLVLKPALMGKDNVAQLEIFSNQAAEVRDALRMPTGGSAAITAQGVAVNADIHTDAGKIALTAERNYFNVDAPSLDVTVGDGVSLSARGGWVNDLPGTGEKSLDAVAVDGGSIRLAAAGNVVLGDDTLLDVGGGVRVKPDGKIKAGNGGDVTLEAGQALRLGGEVHGEALGKGGTYTLKTKKIQIGGATDADTLNLDAAFFERGGFANFNLTGFDGVDIADGTTLRPTVVSRELLAGYTLQPTGSDISAFSQLLKQDDRVRQAANVSFAASNTNAKIRLGESARILADDRAKVSFSAHTRVELLGEVQAAGGRVSAIATRGANDPFDATAAVWLGSNAVLDVSGVARTYTDSRGLTQGVVLAGGTVTLGGSVAADGAVKGGQAYVVTQAGSRIDVSGAAPVRLDVRNEAGLLGRDVGSDAGAVTIRTVEGALLDGMIVANGGGPTNRGGSFSLTLPAIDQTTRLNAGAPDHTRVLALASTTAPQAAGLTAGDAIPIERNGNTRIGAKALEAAGFDRMHFSSESGTIRLENGLNVGAEPDIPRAIPLRELTLDAPRIETAGGDVALAAETVRMGNYGAFGDTAGAAPTAKGTLTVNARQIELAGKLALEGMAQAALNGKDEIRLLGGIPETVTVDGRVFDKRPYGELKTTANMVFHGAVVAPASYVQYQILAPGKTLRFEQGGDAPRQPWSAFGSLTATAKDIVQGGNLWAPLGKIDLQAENTLTFENGSLTSVAADANSVLPFGKLQNGRTWTFDLGAPDTYSIELADVAEQKSILAAASKVDMQAGARVDLSGGGDAQAYEFTVGPGGSRDILADKNTYAILPGFTGGVAPTDAEEKIDRASGEAVYLAGVAGLKDGVYTLLPAHYALLPGAYAIKLDTGIKDVMPGQAYSRQDSVRIAAGYVTDTRVGAPKDANWQGIQVMTHDQVRARSEFTLTRASEFFADSRSRPQDAGLLSVSASGSGSDALKLGAVYDLAAGSGGRGAQVDLSALKLAVTSGAPAGLDPETVVLDAAKLNELGAESVLIGGTRTTSGDTTTLSVAAESLTLANDADHALKAGEVMLAATNTLALESGSAIDAQGASGDAGRYETGGNGAFVRVASTRASFARTGSPDRSQGTLTGASDSTLIATDSITLDATKDNAFNGRTRFERHKTENGAEVTTPVAGHLAVGASRINFGDAPVGSDGLTYTQGELNAIDLAGLTLISYTTFDLHGDVTVGKLDGGKPVLQSLTLQGAGLAGLNNAGKTARLNANQLTLANPNNAASFAAGRALGSGNLEVKADTLTLGSGDKQIQGFGAVTITANELVGSGTGTLEVDAPVMLNVARISGQRGADQAFNATNALIVAQHTADRVLAPVTALGAKWALQGSSLDFDSHAGLPSGTFKLTATAGDIELGENAEIDVAGRSIQFFDVTKPSWGGTAEFVSETGNVDFADGSNVDVSAAAGGVAGTLIVRAANGTFTLADGSGSGSVNGSAPGDGGGLRGEGARADVDVKSLDTVDDAGNPVASFSTFNTAFNTGGFDGGRSLRVRSGDVTIAETDKIKALDIRIAADGGKLDVAGELDASGTDAGRIELFAKGDVNVTGTASLSAKSRGANEDGGDLEIGTREGNLDLAEGSTIDVVGGAGGQGGTVLLRAPRSGVDVNVTALKSAGLAGARAVSVEAFRVYNEGEINEIGTLDNGNVSLAAADLDTIKADNAAFAGHLDAESNYVDHYAAIRDRLGQPTLHVLAGAEVHATGDLTLGENWNLKDMRDNGEAGVLTLRAEGHLNINGNLSDGFSVATPCAAATCVGRSPTSAALLGDDSWSYRLTAGADRAAADPMTVKPGDRDFTLAAGKLIRTGSGDIRVASGHDIRLVGTEAVIYTAGRNTGTLGGFTSPTPAASTYFSHGGGDVSLAAAGSIVGSPSAQLFNNWLFRQGRLNADASAYTTQPAWWVRFDLFQQGVGALGGGDVMLVAGGSVQNVSAHAPTQARLASSTPDAGALTKTGGGTVRVEAGGDVLGGQYYADRGDVVLKAGGEVGSGQVAFDKPIYTLLAVGDGEARVSAMKDVHIGTVFNPHLFNQSRSASNSKSTFNVAGTSGRDTAFSTYTDQSGAILHSLTGAATLHSTDAISGKQLHDSVYLYALNDKSSIDAYGLDLLPPSLSMVAFQGDVAVEGGTRVMLPAADATLELLARDSVRLHQTLVMSDRDPASIPSPALPANPRVDSVNNPKNLVAELSSIDKADPTLHAAVPVHAADPQPVRVHAMEGDVVGRSVASGGAATILDVSKAFDVRAGRDVVNVSIEAQHVNADNDRSRVQAGRDILFATGAVRTEGDHIHVGGPGVLDVIAGRDVDLGTSGGILSRGNTVNPELPELGADIRVAAGVGDRGIDYSGAVDRLLAKLDAGAPDDATLWQARWMTGDDSLTADSARAAVQGVKSQGVLVYEERVRAMLFTALRETGRDFNDADSDYAGHYARGYAALELVFPGIGDKYPDGEFKNYQGGINLFASRIQTQSGGNIEWVVPGGDMVVGLANTPEALLNLEGGETGKHDALGIVAAKEGDIQGFTRGDMLVNQSRILTIGGGDVLLWSSEGDIDAGKGKKTAVTVPPPLILVDGKGNVTQVLQGAASGSGIGALQPLGGTAGDVNLIAPKGTVNAGDAGIRAGNLNIAAQVVLGADNISVSGNSAGTPVADTSAVTAASSGASNAGDDVSSTTASLSQNLADAARAAEQLKQAFKPTFISAEVIGHGE
ncbi:filamentous haemagglutinin family protein [Thiobacillus denitrificans]|nr:filamentous haemagglutinin family protein [Thiobacillus denitrificans]